MFGPRKGLWRPCAVLTSVLALQPMVMAAYDLDPDSTESITGIAKDIAEDLVSFYSGNKPGGTPGLLPEPYYWWYAGAMMGTLVDYWYYTGDDSYVELTKQALVFQVGETKDYMPTNQTLTEGNDDQGFWALTVMSAAESKFPDPKPDEPQWLALAQAVFNTQAARWETAFCGGGLLWQIFDWNKGYDYKNSISNGCFFALASRLALYTGNQTYADWAERTWDWMTAIELIDDRGYVFDGGHIQNNCTDLVPYQFSYNAGVFLIGAAAMYNFTESPEWRSRLDLLLNGTQVFFTGPEKDIMTEVACEPVDRCNLDQQSFKAYLSRWMAGITKWAPYTYDLVMPKLKASAIAATKQCTGGDNGRMCGMKWNKDKWDGTTGVGQQMSALEVTLACMIQDRGAPVTDSTGGTSKGDPSGGGSDLGRTEPRKTYRPITTGDRAGAAILTIVVVLCAIAGTIFLLVDESSDKNAIQQLRAFPSSAGASMAAIAAGGGAITVLRRKKDGSELGEKSNGQTTMVTERSSPSSSGEQVNEAGAMRVGRVRRESAMTHRRQSSMPIGWPQHRVVRDSAIYDSNPEAVSTQESLAEHSHSRLQGEPVTTSGHDESLATDKAGAAATDSPVDLPSVGEEPNVASSTPRRLSKRLSKQSKRLSKSSGTAAP